MVTEGHRREFRSLILYFGAGSLPKAASLLLLPLIVSMLSVESYGTVAYFISWSAFLVPLCALSMPALLVRNSFREERQELLTATMEWTTTLPFLLVCLSAACIAFAVIIGVLDWPSGLFVLGVVFYVAMTVVCEGYASLCRARSEAGRFAVYHVGRSLLDVAFVVLLVVMLSGDWQGRVGAWLMAIAPFSIVGWWRLRHASRLPLLPRRLVPAVVPGLFRMALPLTVYVVSGVVLRSLDRIILEDATDRATLGGYAFAFQVGGAFMVFVHAFSNWWSAWCFRKLAGTTHGIPAVVRRMILVSGIGFLVLAALVGLLCWWLVPLIVPPSYSAYLYLLGPVLMGHVFQIWHQLLHPLLVDTGRVRFFMIQGVTLLVLVPPVLWWVANRYGAFELALVFTGAQGLRFVSLAGMVGWKRHSTREVAGAD